MSEVGSRMEVASLPVVSQYMCAVWSVGVSVCDWLRHSSGAHMVILTLISSSPMKLFSKSSCRKLSIYVFEYVGDDISLQFLNDF